jgi:ligand-binding SRPBCC domain-containing protein
MAAPFAIYAGENLMIQVPIYVLQSGYTWMGVYDPTVHYVVDNALLGPDNIGYHVHAAVFNIPPPNTAYYDALPPVPAEQITSIVMQLLLDPSKPPQITWQYKMIGQDVASNQFSNYIGSDGASTSGSTTYTSASANFLSTDQGKAITGTNIPAGATIASVTNSTTIVLTAAATATGTALSFTIVARVSPIIVGNWYIIRQFTTGDNFTNIGASSNVQGTIFLATGTIPTVWTTSLLRQVQFTSNFQLQVGLFLAELLATDSANLNGIYELRINIASMDNIYISTGAQTDVLCIPNALQVTPC